MEEFQKGIQDLINHCQKTEIDFNLVYKNALLAVNCQESVRKTNSIKETVKRLLKSKKLVYLLLIFSTLFVLYNQLDIITTHASAIGRILMVQVLPFYDWRPLKRERCLIKVNSFLSNEENTKQSKSSKDCNYCDGIDIIPKLQYNEENNLQEVVKQYHDIDSPVIISNTSGTVYNLVKIQEDLEYTQYVPCDVNSNVYFRRSANVEDIFGKLAKTPFYFAHWRNCHSSGMKQFRRFFPRPEYLPVNFSPIQQSWLVLSKNYKSGNQIYKQLSLRGRLAVVVVIRGHLKARLTPMRFCFAERFCNDIIVDLEESDALVISDQWEIDYLLTSGHFGHASNMETTNMAIVLETR